MVPVMRCLILYCFLLPCIELGSDIVYSGAVGTRISKKPFSMNYSFGTEKSISKSFQPGGNFKTVIGFHLLSLSISGMMYIMMGLEFMNVL